MGQNTKIEWCHHSWNPWRGCTKVSPGCAYCYAETMSHRNPGVLGVWGDKGTRVIASEAAWREPYKWNRAAARAGERHRVFCASLADVFEDRTDLIEPRIRLFATITNTPNLDWLLLTKRPENVRRLIREAIVWATGTGLDATVETLCRWDDGDPPANVWLGTSVEDQAAADARIPHLLQMSAVVRFLSMEPLLGPVDLYAVPRPDNAYFRWRGETGVIGPKSEPDDFVYWSKRGIHWVIVGGESGPKARLCDARWIRDIVTQCKAAGVPAFVKQMGANVMDSGGGDGTFADLWSETTSNTFFDGDGTFKVWLRDKKGGDITEFPSDLQVREFPAMVPTEAP